MVDKRFNECLHEFLLGQAAQLTELRLSVRNRHRRLLVLGRGDLRLLQVLLLKKFWKIN